MPSTSHEVHPSAATAKNRRSRGIASKTSSESSWFKHVTVRRKFIAFIGFAASIWIWLWIRQHGLVMRHQQQQQQVQNHNINSLSFLTDSSSSSFKFKSKQRKSNSTTKVALASSTVPLLRLVTTAFLEPLDRLWLDTRPIKSLRNTSSSALLTKVLFPRVTCNEDRVVQFPIDDYPTDDPFLPWIHDYFPTHNGSYVQFVAQNRRRCNSGKDHQATMKFWEPQVSLFQPIPIDRIGTRQNELWNNASTQRHFFRLAPSPDNATFPETRFMCRFHNHRGQEEITFSEYDFNYEYITWRHHIPTMLAITGSDANNIWLSQLLFRCPVPAIFRDDVVQGRHGILDPLSHNHHHHQTWVSQLWVDVIPIRTPVRHGTFLLTNQHAGPRYVKGAEIFDIQKQGWGTDHVLPDISDAGRWANLPICQIPHARASPTKPFVSSDSHNRGAVSSVLSNVKPFHLVACTWTAASYTRRGDAVAVNDSARRLREWIVFHLLVGFDHLYVYDNTQNQQEPSPLLSIATEYQDHVTYIPWPCKVCNNNRPNHPNSGERSSQYAAEASCRERYGPMTEWMAFIDTDEYLVPMTPLTENSENSSIPTWHDLLHAMEANQTHILKMRSSRAKPRYELMEVQGDQSTCQDPKRPLSELDPCIGPRHNETFLRVYNCEFIKPPRPPRFDRAMKQIYRPEYVLSHFVHYSIVTTDTARYYADTLVNESSSYRRNIYNSAPVTEVFLDELTQGTLIHTRSVLPHETKRRSSECVLNSKNNCILGYPCPNSVEFVDGLYQKNAFRDEAGKYCNCWVNERVETILIPQVEATLRRGKRDIVRFSS